MKRISILASYLMTLLLFTACGVPTTPQAPINLEPQANYWQQVGTFLDANTNQNARNPSLALDSSGNPVVSWDEWDGTSNNIYVNRWNGSSWVQLGTFLDANTNQNARNPSLALNSSGNPVVSWNEWDGTSFNIYVKRWDGSSWVQLGTFLDVNTNRGALNPSLALNSSGNPVVSWNEWDGTSFNIYVKRWDGSSWVQLGGILDANTNQDAANPSLALDSSDNPVVSWYENGTSRNIYVKRWDGSSWVQLGGILDFNANQNAFNPSLALDSSGNPVVSWYEDGGTSFNIYVKRWNGSSWVQLGTFLDANTNQFAANPSLALDSSGNPVVSWEELDGTSANIYVKRWNGSSWVQLGTFLDANTNQFAANPSLALDSSGNPVVSWNEFDGISDNIYVKRYLSNAWQPLGDTLDTTISQNANTASIARKSNNNPVVAWQEFDGTSNNVYVKEWTETTWSALGGVLDRIAGDAKNPSIAMRSDNRPTVAFQENNNVYVRRWSGTAWVNIGVQVESIVSRNAITPSLALDSANLPVVAYVENNNILVKQANGVVASSVWTSPYGTASLDITTANVASRPSLALKSDNRPIVAWYENVGSSTNIYVKEWNGTAWVQLGTTLDMVASQNAKDVVLSIRSDNRPVVAWEEVGNIYVKQWTGSAWTSIGGALDRVIANVALRPSLDLRSDNNPVVTWQEGSSTNYNVYVKRWTGSKWANVSASALDKTLSQTAQRPALILKSNNNPIVAWDESDGTSTNILVKQY